MSIKTRLDKLEIQAGTKPSAEALRVADSAIKLGLILQEQREEFARTWPGFEAVLAELREVQS